METPFVSVIIPCRNEEKYIGKCLETILSQDYPADRMEVLVVDGVSVDKTREIVESYKLKAKSYKLYLLDNPHKFTSFGLNIGIKNSQGALIIRMDAHAGYERDYVSKCVKYLKEYNADNIGGPIKTLPAKNTISAKAIALSLSNIFGAASDFRRGIKKPQEADTVFGGCYKRDVFDKIGFFNENLIRSQDLEFNLRLKKAGGKIILHPEIISYYYPKSNLREFFLHSFKDGIWVILPLKFVKMPFKLRHYIPLIFILSLPLSIWPYLLASLFFSLQVAFREKDLGLFFIMPFAFGARHFGYGMGSIFGLFRLLKSWNRAKISDMGLLDLVLAFLGLILVSPLFLVVAFLIKKESPGPVFYRGMRVGKNGKLFRIFKFRTMVLDAEKLGGPSTAGDDPRLLKIGKFLRRHNLDEFPELINVLRGEMSLVGPRPEFPSEVETYDEETKKIILSVKPGLTDLATLANLHEEEILRGSPNPHQTYREIIKPQKIKLAMEYVKNRSFWLDIKIILKTLKSAFF